MKESFLNFHDLVLILTVVECFCMAVLIKVLPDQRVYSRKIMSLFFVVVALVLISTLIVWNTAFLPLAINQTSMMIVIFVACLLLQGPLLYFYIRSLSDKVQSWTKKDALHLLPVIIGCSMVIMFDITTMDWKGLTTPAAAKARALSSLWLLVKFSPFAYVIASAIYRYRIHQHLRNGFSRISEVELTLADVLLLGFLLHWVWTLVAFFLADWVHWRVSDIMGIINNYVMIAVINGLFVGGLSNAEKLLNPEPIVPDKTIPVKNKEEKIALIEKAIHEDKIYLESTLNLERFAERLGMRVRDVSNIIKTQYHTNFFEFINSYRIEEVKRLLLLDTNSNDTILDIIYKAGFNSLSTFHRVFKRMVGVTPKEFRRQGGIEMASELETTSR